MIKILFCGFRHSHVNALYKKVEASSDFCVFDCVEENAEAREAAKKALGASFSQKGYAELLKSDCDAVAIGTAYGERGAAIIEALKAGKHVISDKPICTSLEELNEIRRLCSEKGLKIACMLDLRYLPQALKAKELLDSGRLGEIRNLSFGGQHCLDRAHRPSWYFEEGMHGGTINDIAIHGIDLVRMLTGLEFTQTDAARAWNSYASDVKHFKDSATFMARLENGAGVLADVSYSAPAMGFLMPTYWEFRFWCANGLLTFNYAEKAVKVYENKASAPCTYDCADSDEDYLTEFIRELNDKSNMTENILASTKTALLIQGEADKELL